jgi:hypothetical protein
VFIAAFALIITGAQGIVRITATEPWAIFLQGAAMMAPVTIAALILVFFVWWRSRPKPVR